MQQRNCVCPYCVGLDKVLGVYFKLLKTAEVVARSRPAVAVANVPCGWRRLLACTSGQIICCAIL
jgi:hypothetical protein